MLVMAMAARRQIGRATWFRRPGERAWRLGIQGRQVVLGQQRGVDPQAGKVGVLCAQVFQSHQRPRAFEGQLDLPSQAIGSGEALRRPVVWRRRRIPDGIRPAFSN